MFPDALTSLGWDSFYQQQIVDLDPRSLLPVRVMSVHRSGLEIAGDGIREFVETSPRAAELRPTIGDWLLVSADTLQIERRLERKSLFKRRAPGTDRREQLIAANIDTLFVVSSCNQDFNEARLERYLAIGREAECMAVIVLTKSDLCADPQEYVRRAGRLAAAIPAESVNALDRSSLVSLEPWLQAGQTIALLGSSGVGKSTLTNTLLGDQSLATSAIREDDAKGRHTTTARSMHQLVGGAWLMDTPGMRELQLTDAKAGLDDVFAEISALAGKCKFADCTHESEPGCAVRRAVQSGDVELERLQRWRKLTREEARNSESIAERRARDKSFGRLIKNVVEEKDSRKRR